MAPKLLTVQLDRARSVALTQLALYRMSTLPRPFEIQDVFTQGRSFGALVAWLWAMLGPDDVRDFATPEDLAQHVPMDPGERLKLIEVFAECVNAAAGSAKNANGSTRKPSPASSSGSVRRSSGG